MLKPQKNGKKYQNTRGKNIARSQISIKVKAENISISAHKVILEARCPYFHGMFNNQLKEYSQDAVTLTDISGESLPILIDFI